MPPPERRFVHEPERWWTKRRLYLNDSIDLSQISPERFRQVRVVTCVIAFVVVMGLPFVLQYWALGIHWMSMAVGATILGGLVSIALVRFTGRPTLGGWVGISMLLVLLVLSNVASGGFYDPNFGWLYAIPILAALVVDARAGWLFTGVVLLLTFGFYFAPALGFELHSLIPPEEHAMQSLINRASAVLAIGVALSGLVSQQRYSSRLLEEANEGLRDEMVQRQQAAARLLHAERMASMGSVAASVAHEINNPLTYLTVNLTELRGRLRGTDHETLQMLDEAAEGAARVQSLVADLRTFSREDEADPGPVDVDDALALAVRMVANEARHRAELVHERIPGSFVAGHERRLVQVMLNLLTNALHAIPEASKRPHRVSLRAVRREAFIEIEVEDDGVGIPEADRARVFEPFFTTKTIGVGTGLGLSISRNVVEAMNGTLELESKEEGTIARIVLPAIEPPVHDGDTTGTFAKASGSRGGRILVVDDEPAILAAIRRVLTDHEVEVTGSAVDALERCTRGNYDVILCDLMMPELSGAQLYAALEKRGLHQRVVFMTGGVFTPSTVAFMETCPNVVLHKPFTPATLKQAVADALDALGRVQAG